MRKAAGTTTVADMLEAAVRATVRGSHAGAPSTPTLAVGQVMRCVGSHKACRGHAVDRDSWADSRPQRSRFRSLFDY